MNQHDHDVIDDAIDDRSDFKFGPEPLNCGNSDGGALIGAVADVNAPSREYDGQMVCNAARKPGPVRNGDCEG